MYTLRFDGLFMELPGYPIEDESPRRPQIGIMGIGWLVTRGLSVVAQGHGAFARRKDASSNVAEYLALIEGLDALSDLGINGELVKVFGDSKTVIEQMRGVAAVNAESMWPVHLRARELAHRFLDLRWIWTPRKNNKAADRLTRRAVRQLQNDRAGFETALETIATERSGCSAKSKLHVLLDLRVYHPAQDSAVRFIS